MNVANAKTLRGQLARLPDKKFAMPQYIQHNDCGTVACIAGWASLLNGGPQTDDGAGSENLETDPDLFAKEWLDLTEREADWLFAGEFAAKPLYQITRAEAIAELDRLIDQHEARP